MILRTYFSVDRLFDKKETGKGKVKAKDIAEFAFVLKGCHKN